VAAGGTGPDPGRRPVSTRTNGPTVWPCGPRLTLVPLTKDVSLGRPAALVGDVRRLAFDRTLDDADRARRIRDRFGEYDGLFDDG
jgi:hypothetical protein